MHHLESMAESTLGGKLGILTSSSSRNHHSTFQQAKLTKEAMVGKEQNLTVEDVWGWQLLYWFMSSLQNPPGHAGILGWERLFQKAVCLSCYNKISCTGWVMKIKIYFSLAEKSSIRMPT